jgi:hypothetical protein
MNEKLQNLRDINDSCLDKHDKIVQLVIDFLEENFESIEDFEKSKLDSQIPENMSLIKNVLERSWGGV